MTRICFLTTASLALSVFFPAGPVFGQQTALDDVPQTQAPRDTLRFGLQEALERSLQESPEVGQREAQLRYAEARHDQARASRFLTQFSAETEHSVAPTLERSAPGATSIDELTKEQRDALYLLPDVENNWEAFRPYNAISVQVGQPLWTWGELSGQIRAARYGATVDAARVGEKALEVAFRTGELYYNVLLAQSLSRLTDEAGQALDRAKEEVQTQLEEGAPDVDDADLFQVQIAEQDYKRRVIEVEQRLRTAVSGLSRQLFVPEETAALPDTSVLAPLNFDLRPLDFYTEMALQNRPELKQAAAGIQARKAQVEVEQSNYYPKLFVGGSAGIRYAPGRYRQPSAYISDDYRGRSVRAGFSLRQQLNFFQTEAKVDQARAQLNEVRYQQEAARQLTRFEVEEAYRNVITTRGALQARDRALTLGKKWERVELTNFDLDLGSTENLVNAVQTRLQLQISYYQAARDYNVAVLRLLRVIGILNEPKQTGTLVDFL